ncbi:histidine phosphatase family protein [Paracoccus seriniphilus]|uniref:histidine phosphatase family protein n=1 Tax=Paracoccus seriniphilus TaxID=184748 RepID=UPI000B783FBC|nr:histidine phosphatase family protein [Paracoccus seriniphilus]WCR14639.1 histidine phosphatase family protein [Paracoccus seriniphilus]
MTLCPDLYLMRHGQTFWNVEGRLQGRLNSDLTPRGRQQAADLAAIIRSIDAPCFSSPQGRALETARIAFEGREFRVDSRLAEIDVGEFTGMRLADLRQSHPAIFINDLDWYDQTPSGEHFTELHARCRDFLADLNGPALIVTHGVTLRMLRLLAMGWPLSRLGELTVEQGALHVIRERNHQIWRKTCLQRSRGLDSARTAG